MIPALVLAAGVASRLRPLSRVRAKAALPVAGRPLVEHIIARLSAAGVGDLVINLHHLPHTITRRIGDGSQAGVRVRYSWEAVLLGSAGGPRHALPLLASTRFLIVNGDTLTDVDPADVIRAHERRDGLVTMAVVRNTEPHKYGGVLVDPDGAVTGFTGRGSTAPSFHFVGVQVAEAEAFADLADGVPHETVGALYPALMAARPGSIRAYVCEAAFLDIGTAADYVATCRHLAAGPSADSDGNIVWDDVAVEPGGRARRSVLTDGVRVPAGADWSDVTVRVARGELEPFERRHGELAIAPIAR
jgi:NDP-sugar pyrophosphorylase family protein